MSDQGSKAGGDFIRDLGNAVRDNPLPAALIGMGVVWMITGGKPLAGIGAIARGADLPGWRDSAADALASGQSAVRAGIGATVDGAAKVGGQIGDAGGALGQSVGGGVASTGSSLRDAGAAAARRLSDTASQASNAAADYVRPALPAGGQFLNEARSNLAELMRERPLFLGAIGLAIGAGIAASLRTTEFEADLLGDTSDSVKRQISETAAEQLQRVNQLAGGAMSAIANEVRTQNLTVDGLKSGASEAVDKVKNVAGAATESLRRQLN